MVIMPAMKKPAPSFLQCRLRKAIVLSCWNPVSFKVEHMKFIINTSNKLHLVARYKSA